MEQPGLTARCKRIPRDLWAGPPVRPARTAILCTGAALLGSASLVLPSMMREGRLAGEVAIAGALVLAAGLLWLATAASPWVRRPALVLLVTGALAALCVAAVAVAIVGTVRLVLNHPAVGAAVVIATAPASSQ